jgi:hypothetical protein
VTPTIQSSISANRTITPTTQSVPLPFVLVILAVGCIGIFAVGQRRRGNE